MKTFYPKTRKDWRAWLRKNHQKEDQIALVHYKKHTKKPSVNVMEAMHEAICWGWIDTTIKRLDEDRYIRKFRKRTKNSRWSSNTLQYAKQMIKEGKMSKFGLKMYTEGSKKDVIDHGIPKDAKAPPDLKKALERNKKAKEFFNTMAPSTRRIYIIQVLTAKLPETKKKRIKEIVARCKAHKKFGE